MRGWSRESIRNSYPIPKRLDRAWWASEDFLERDIWDYEPVYDLDKIENLEAVFEEMLACHAVSDDIVQNHISRQDDRW
jgi:hypothetical protein